MTVILAQTLLIFTALAHVASPFFVFYYMTDTLAYYGISVSDGREPLITAFVLRILLLILILGITGLASWGMIKGNRIGRLFSCGVFAWVVATLVLDVLWPDDNFRVSSYLTGFPQWLDVLLKLAIAGVYGFFLYRIGFGRRELVYFDRYRVLGYTNPPHPPTFSD